MSATLPPPRLLPSGDSAITVEFSRNIDDAANQRVLALDRTIAREPIAGVTETVPTYRSLLVHYDPVQIGFDALSEQLVALAQLPVPPVTTTRRWRIPVVYGGEHGIDLEDVAKDAEHHAGRYRGAACRRRLPGRHDRLYAGLVLSQRPGKIAAYVAAAKSAAADAGRHDLDRRRADRRAVSGRPQRLASAWDGLRSAPISCIAIPPSCSNPATPSRLPRSTPRPSRTRTAPPSMARSSPN